MNDELCFSCGLNLSGVKDPGNRVGHSNWLQCELPTFFLLAWEVGLGLTANLEAHTLETGIAKTSHESRWVCYEHVQKLQPSKSMKRRSLRHVMTTVVAPFEPQGIAGRQRVWTQACAAVEPSPERRNTQQRPTSYGYPNCKMFDM